MTNKCKNCGYCEHCGRCDRLGPYYPYQPYPYQPVYPYWRAPTNTWDYARPAQPFKYTITNKFPV